MQEHFFKSFFGSEHQNIDFRPIDIINNEIVLEISNNWQFIIDLIKNGKKRYIDEIEHSCISYIQENNINILEFKNNEEFVEKFWKLP